MRVLSYIKRGASKYGGVPYPRYSTVFVFQVANDWEGVVLPSGVCVFNYLIKAITVTRGREEGGAQLVVRLGRLFFGSMDGSIHRQFLSSTGTGRTAGLVKDGRHMCPKVALMRVFRPETMTLYQVGLSPFTVLPAKASGATRAVALRVQVGWVLPLPKAIFRVVHNFVVVRRSNGAHAAVIVMDMLRNVTTARPYPYFKGPSLFPMGTITNVGYVPFCRLVNLLPIRSFRVFRRDVHGSIIRIISSLFRFPFRETNGDEYALSIIGRAICGENSHFYCGALVSGRRREVFYTPYVPCTRVVIGVELSTYPAKVITHAIAKRRGAVVRNDVGRTLLFFNSPIRVSHDGRVFPNDFHRALCLVGATRTSFVLRVFAYVLRTSR